MPIEVTHNESAKRFEVPLEASGLAVLDYRISDGSIIFLHTEVPHERRGEGVGPALVREALRYARSANLKVVARCSYVAAYLRRHPDEAGAGASGAL